MLRIDVDQDRARQLGVSSQDIATLLNNVVGGSVDHPGARQHLPRSTSWRAPTTPSAWSIETFQGLQIAGRDGQPMPLPAIATIEYELEQPLVWRRDRQPTITLQATVVGDAAAGHGRRSS